MNLELKNCKDICIELERNFEKLGIYDMRSMLLKTKLNKRSGF